jgi:hypothetical protein
MFKIKCPYCDNHPIEIINYIDSISKNNYYYSCSCKKDDSRSLFNLENSYVVLYRDNLSVVNFTFLYNDYLIWGSSNDGGWIFLSNNRNYYRHHSYHKLSKSLDLNEDIFLQIKEEADRIIPLLIYY